MRGRWAAGIKPRNFAWILKDQLAVSERPGGFAPHHRRVRRQEEIFWLNAQGFTRIVSLLPSNHNLHAYDELHVLASHFALPSHGDVRPVLAELYPSMWQWLHDGERILLHQEELSEQVAGVAAGFLCWSGLLAEPPRAVSAVEQLLKRQMGSAGRTIAAAAAELAPASTSLRRQPGALLDAAPAAGQRSDRDDPKVRRRGAAPAADASAPPLPTGPKRAGMTLVVAGSDGQPAGRERHGNGAKEQPAKVAPAKAAAAKAPPAKAPPARATRASTTASSSATAQSSEAPEPSPAKVASGGRSPRSKAQPKQGSDT